MITKKIKTMMFIDWDMWETLTAFMNYVDPVIRYKGQEYKVELGKLMAKPHLCGTDIKEEANFIIDRCSHWNGYYKCMAHTAMNSGIKFANNSQTNSNLDKQNCYDVLIKGMHPHDRHPVTVLLPQFNPYTDDQISQYWWQAEQEQIIANTKFGFDPDRSYVDWDKFNAKMKRSRQIDGKIREIRAAFYEGGNYIKEAVEKYFDNKFPLYLKKGFGGGGSDVYKVNSLEELYEKYDETGGKVFHIQEAIENYDIFIRCMAIGPQVLPMRYQPEAPIHQHYSEEKIRIDKDVFERLKNYVLHINSYHRWTYNSFECLIKEGVIHPIDYANACPDSFFTSLHAHFPWLICALVKWSTFCAVTDVDLRVDMEQKRYQKILNDPKVSQLEKYEFCAEMNKEYFQIDKFQEYCEENFKGLEDKMIDFYDKNIDKIIDMAMHYSDFPKEEHGHMARYYKNLMEENFRANARDYLTSVIFNG